MKFHRSIYALVAIFFLMTKVGVAFNLHFCGEQLASVTTMFESNGCGMEMAAEAKPSCESEQLSKPSCCSDEVLLVQNQDENPISDVLSLSQDQLMAVLTTALVFDLFSVESESWNNQPPHYHYDSHAPPLYALYCSYTFYG
ncbi:hypothetical protein ACFQ1M_16080 [Sungkyunkwania multivorans]|uniref:Uncharacterized protein n=1 Tax=Sungkyunkwania multivorans TaxID=1173618 RepID=A0ABW3D3P2_9FLAO